jgi:hypothetical protein
VTPSVAEARVAVETLASYLGSDGANPANDWPQFRAALDALLTVVRQEERERVDEILCDGWAVYCALRQNATPRTSAENVSDTLDAAMDLIRESRGPRP